VLIQARKHIRILRLAFMATVIVEFVSSEEILLEAIS